MPRIQLKQDGSQVLMLVDGALIASVPWQAALEVSQALRSVGKLAEEHASAQSIIMDQAILTRAGWPFMGLTAHPTLLAEAAKEAAWSSDLRRYLPGGIKSQEHLPPPRIVQSRPSPNSRQGARNDK